MARKTEAERDRRAAAVGGDGDARAQLTRRSAVTDARSHDDGPMRARVDDRVAHGDVRVELTASLHRLLQQQPVEIAPQNRAAEKTARVPAFERGAALAGDEHPVDAQSARVDRGPDAETPQPRERAGIDRVAAQFVAGKVGAIDEAHARAGARQQHRGYGAGRSRTDDQYVQHWVIGESGNRGIDWNIARIQPPTARLPDYPMT